MIKVRPILAFMIFAWSCFLGLHVNAQQYNFQTYHFENDLDIANQGDIYSSGKGYLYIGGGESIYRFNGQHCDKLFPNLDLPFSEIKDIKELPNGTIYYLNNSKLSFLNKQGKIDALPLNEEILCYEFVDDNIYYGTKKGLKIYAAQSNTIYIPESLSTLENFQINKIVKHDSDLFLATNHGLWVFHTKLNTLNNYNQTSDYDIQDIVIDRQNVIWGFNKSGDILAVKEVEKTLQLFQNKSFSFTKLIVDEKDRIWFGTNNRGILRFDQDKGIWRTIDQNRGLSDNRITDLILDSWGSIWISTADNMLSKFIDKDFELFNVYNGLEQDQINSTFANDSELWFSCGNKGVFNYKEGAKLFESIPDAVLDIKCTAILKSGNNIWVGTNGKGLVKINKSENTVFRKETGLPSDWISQVVADSINNIWIGTPSNGIARLSQKDSSSLQVELFGLAEGLEDLHITTMFVSTENVLYYGTESGKVGKIKNGNHELITSVNLILSEINDIDESPNGEIFIATNGQGIFHIGKKSKEQLIAYTVASLILPQNISNIKFKGNNLWFSDDKGIYQLINESEIPTLNHFTISDGFPSANILKGSMVEFKNKIWIGSKDGLIRVGEIASTLNKVPKIHFKEIKVDFESIDFTMGLTKAIPAFNYNQKQFSFNYEGVDINSNRDLNYSYILEGQDNKWSPWSRNDNQSYNNLKPGNYIFKVRAISSGGGISETLNYTFAINSPFWMKWWFVPSIILLSISSIYMIFRFRIQKIKRKNDDERLKLELKNRLLELEQKANQLQMNPHFIFNALNSIQATVAKEDYHDARKEINDFAFLMRSILSNSKERVISLKDELSLLDKYIKIEKSCRSLNFDYEFQINQAINEEEVLIPPMLIQPFIENAIVHGLKKKINGGKLIIGLKLLDDKVLNCTIHDNGLGYETNQKLKTESGHKSVAISVTKERLENLLEKKYHPAVVINQIDEKLGGTIVALKIPIEYNF